MYAQIAHHTMQLGHVEARVLNEQQDEETRERLVVEQLSAAPRLVKSGSGRDRSSRGRRRRRRRSAGRIQPLVSTGAARYGSQVESGELTGAEYQVGVVEVAQVAPQPIEVASVQRHSAAAATGARAVQVCVVEERRGSVVDAAQAAVSGRYRVASARAHVRNADAATCAAAAGSPAASCVAVCGGCGEQVDLALALLLLEGARLVGQVLGQSADLAVVHVEQNSLAQRTRQSAQERRVVVVSR